ncbi:MAG: transposase [Microgenomates group bacterium]
MIKILHQRKRNRLRNFDYSSSGWYFVTVCTKDREEYFGNVVSKKMILNKYGEIVKQQWLWLEKHFLFIKLDQWIIMPNHLHGIVIIKPHSIIVRNGRDRSLLVKIKPLSDFIGAFKTTSSKMIHQSGLNDFQWQKSFYDHIIRNKKSLFAIRQYIKDNPKNWEKDRNNPENLFM